MEKIINPIKNFFNPPRGKTVNVLRTGPDEIRQVDEALRRQLGTQEGELAKRAEYIKKLEERIGKLEGKETEEEKVVKELLKERMKIEFRKEERRIALVFKKPLRILTHDKKLYTDGRIKYPFMRGLELEDTEDGYGWNLLVESANTQGLVSNAQTSRVSYRLPLDMIFEDPQHLVASMKSGVVSTLFDSRGIFHQPEEMDARCATCDSAEDMYAQLTRLKKKYENRIAEIGDENSELRSKLKDMGKREVGVQARAADLETALDTADFRADMTQSQAAAQMEKFKKMSSEHLSLMSTAQDSELNRILTERFNEVVLAAFKQRLQAKGIELSQEDEERIEEKLRGRMQDSINFVEELIPTKFERQVRTTEPHPTTPIKKEEKPSKEVVEE